MQGNQKGRTQLSILPFVLEWLLSYFFWLFCLPVAIAICHACISKDGVSDQSANMTFWVIY